MLAEGDKWTKKYLLSWGLFVYLSNLSTAAYYFFTFRKSYFHFFVLAIFEQLFICK